MILYTEFALGSYFTESVNPLCLFIFSISNLDHEIGTVFMANFSRNTSFYKPQQSTPLTKKHLSVTIEGLDNLGSGIAYIKPDAKSKKIPTFIEGALVGETVRIQLTEKKAKYARAKLIAIDSPSPNRIQPVCPHYQTCGGCQLQHMSHDDQVVYKSTTLLNLFKKISPKTGDSFALEPAILSPEFGYRRRARISLNYDPKSQQLIFGFRQSASHQITPISSCRVLVPQLDVLLPEVKALLETFSKPRSLGHLELVFDGKTVAILLRHIDKLSPTDEKALLEFATHRKLSLYLQSNNETLQYVSGQALHYSETGFDVDFLPTDFIQVNEAVNQKMVEQAVNWLDIQPTDKVLDLFCGLGNFSFSIAQKAQKVIGVEGVQAMVSRATQNACQNNLSNVDFYQANLEDDQHQALWAQQSFDKVILDPARAGAFGVLKQMTEFSPSKIVYISCNPATLARDTQQLASLGYTLKHLMMLDMFPQTRHLESMALFVKSTKAEDMRKAAKSNAIKTNRSSNKCQAPKRLMI